MWMGRSRAENPQLFDRCRYDYDWITGPDGQRLLCAPLTIFEKTTALKYITVLGTFKEWI